jgi:hypothetical protein
MPPPRNLKGRRLFETREETESVIASLMERGVALSHHPQSRKRASVPDRKNPCGYLTGIHPLRSEESRSGQRSKPRQP